jgi:DNA-3-methyladenine glycosylase
MFGPPGHLYVYRSYGLHWCANIVCEEEGRGAAVLLRALEPTDGIGAMRARRGLEDERLLCAGPGRLTQALGIVGSDNGADLTHDPFVFVAPTEHVEIERTPRIGISKATEKLWRYVERGSSWPSRARPAA